MPGWRNWCSMDEDEKSSILALYTEYDRVTGPYTRASDQRKVVALTGYKKTTTRQLAKVRLEVMLGRRLIEGETVDHKDENHRNDEPQNLQLLSKSENSRKSSIGNKHSLGRKIPEDQRRKGENNSRSLISNENVECYRLAFAKGAISKSEIMSQTGMSEKSVRNFLYGDTYSDARYVVEKPSVGRPRRK